jgi:predicted dehydrogenase
VHAVSNTHSRRAFLKSTAAVGAGFWVSGRARAQTPKSPNEVLRFACIGIDGKGDEDSKDVARQGDVVAICDIDDRTVAKAAETFPNAAKFNDYRQMFDQMAGSIDAVTISTPDHTHAVMTAMAMRLGKHCFTQKPLTHTIYEARRLGEIARETKVATQMGNQGSAESTLRKAVAQIQAGSLGTVKEVHVWTDRPKWPQGIGRVADATPPAGVHWDLWLGPAPARPYGPLYHPFAWRGWWEFGTGALGDMACHTVNMPFLALDLRNPVAVTAEHPGHNGETYPKKSTIKFEFAATEKRPALLMIWYDGGNKPPAELFEGRDRAETGSLVVGEKGKLYSPGSYCGVDVQLFSGATDVQVEFEKSPGHIEEWVHAIRGGPPALSNFADCAGPLTETILLGNLAVWAGPNKRVVCDAKNMKATNDTSGELAKIIKTTYRDGYTL